VFVNKAVTASNGCCGGSIYRRASQVLSLSFITAMSRVSEEEAPLVMDTPFGRLSSHP
jgi:hypothetical protein